MFAFTQSEKKNNIEDVRSLWFQFLWSRSCIDSKPFTPEHQYAYSPISRETLIGDHFLYSREVNV